MKVGLSLVNPPLCMLVLAAGTACSRGPSDAPTLSVRPPAAIDEQTRRVNSSDPIVRFAVHTVNLRGGYLPGTNINLTQRMGCHIATFKSSLTAHGLMGWDLIGVQESEPVMCPVTLTTIQAADCLALSLPSQQRPWVHVDGAYGLIVNTDKFEILEEPKSAIIGMAGAEKRNVVGVMLRARANGRPLFFATTHLLTSDAHFCWRRKQAEEMTQWLDRWAPARNAMLVGDFNCTLGETSWEPDSLNCLPTDDAPFMSAAKNNKKLCRYIESKYTNSGGFQIIDQILLRKPGSSVVARVKRSEILQDFSDNGCTDHYVAYNELESGTGCVGTCAPGQCGSDGCKGYCQTCPAGSTCRNGACIGCDDSCEGRQCGVNACGRSCGTCSRGFTCRGGQCRRSGTIEP